MVALASPALAADRKWSRLEGCRYLEHKSNDGDSFQVQCGKEKFFARFYFVDAPEAKGPQVLVIRPNGFSNGIRFRVREPAGVRRVSLDPATAHVTVDQEAVR